MGHLNYESSLHICYKNSFIQGNIKRQNFTVRTNNISLNLYFVLLSALRLMSIKDVNPN